MIVLKKLGGIRLPALVALFAALMMLFSLLLPYATATGNWDEFIQENPDMVVFAEWEVTGSDAQSFSLLDLTLNLNDQYQSMQDEMAGVILIVLLALCGLFCLLTILFPLVDKAIPTIVFALLALGPFYLLSEIMTNDHAIGAEGASYALGVGYYLF